MGRLLCWSFQCRYFRPDPVLNNTMRSSDRIHFCWIRILRADSVAAPSGAEKIPSVLPRWCCACKRASSLTDTAIPWLSYRSFNIKWSAKLFGTCKPDAIVWASGQKSQDDLPIFEGFYHRRTSFCLNSHHARPFCVFNPAQRFEFGKGFPHSHQAGTTTGRKDNHVR